MFKDFASLEGVTLPPTPVTPGDVPLGSVTKQQRWWMRTPEIDITLVKWYGYEPRTREGEGMFDSLYRRAPSITPSQSLSERLERNFGLVPAER